MVVTARAEVVTEYLHAEPVYLAIAEAMTKRAKLILRQEQKTVEKWAIKPEFRIHVEGQLATKNEVTYAIGTDNDIYRFLEFGTKERWAVMSHDWRSKTVPKLIGNVPGQGIPVLRGKGMMAAVGLYDPMPGIQAREWLPTIAERETPAFLLDIQRAVEKGVKEVQNKVKTQVI